MFKALFKKQLMEQLTAGRGGRKKGKAAMSKGVTALYIVLLAVLAVSFFAIGKGLCAALVPMGMDWLYFAIMGLIAIALGVFGSVFSTYASLYLAKDNELLISLPIPPVMILAARLFGVWLWGTVFEAVVFVPGLAAFWVTAGLAGRLTAVCVVSGVITAILMSLFILAVTCVLGWVIAKISVRLKNKSFITVIVAVLFLAAYYVVYFKVQRGLQNILTNAQMLSESIRGWARPAYWLGLASAGSLLHLLLIAVIVAVLTAAVCVVLSRTFVKLATANYGGAKKQYREKTARRESPDRALLTKELRRFTGSANYMLNCGLGTILLPVAGVAALIFRGQLRELLTALPLAISPALLGTAALCMVAAFNDISAPSVSLEGKELWLVQSLPVSPWSVLKAKLELHILLTVIPTLFCSVCLVTALRPPAGGGIMMVVTPALYVVLAAAFGLMLNLKTPNLTWTHETVPIKQSMAVVVCLFGGWVLALVLMGAGIALQPVMGAGLYLLLWAALAAVLTAAILRWLKTKGTKIFASL